MGILTQIKNRFSGTVISEAEVDGETESIRLGMAAMLAWKEKTYLLGAYLRGAYLLGADLRGADLQGAYLLGAYLLGADLRGAYLRRAYLLGAYLRRAYLRHAYLRGADLRGADLQGADLRGADLLGADLRGADGVNKYLSTPLMILMEQPGQIRAYKLITAAGTGTHPCLTYKIGQEYYEKNACCDDTQQCALGISLASLDWCCKEWRPGFRILVAEFTAEDIAAIPIASDGKFRVHRCKIVGEKDLVELGLVEAQFHEAVALIAPSATKK